MTGEVIVSPLVTRKVFKSAAASFKSRFGKLSIPSTDSLKDVLDYYGVTIPDKLLKDIENSISEVNSIDRSTLVVLVGTQLQLIGAGKKALYKINITLSEFDKMKNLVTV